MLMTHNALNNVNGQSSVINIVIHVILDDSCICDVLPLFVYAYIDFIHAQSTVPLCLSVSLLESRVTARRGNMHIMWHRLEEIKSR